MKFSRKESAVIAAVIAAYSEGKEIQSRYLGSNTAQWLDIVEEPRWNWDYYEYRVKPEPPRNFWAVENSDGEVYTPDRTEAKAREHLDRLSNSGLSKPYKLIHLREVLDD